MGRLLKVAVVVIVAAGLLAVGGSYATGFFFRGGFQSHVEQASLQWQMHSGGKASIRLERYELGIFGATAQTRVMMGPTASILINHKIRYGLGTGFTSYGKVRTEVELPQEISGMARILFGSDLFGGRAPLAVDSVIGWTGDMRHRIESPGFTGKAKGVMDIAWGGIDGEISIGPGRRSVAWRLELPGFSMANNKNRIEIGRLHTKGDTARAEAHLFWIGQAELGIDKLVIQIKDKLEKTKRDLLPHVELENLKLSSDTRENSGSVDSTVTFSLDRAVAADDTLDAAQWTLAVENLDADALDAFLKIVETFRQGDNEVTPQVLADALKQEPALTAAFLRRKPVIALKDGGVRLKQGDFRLNARLSYAGDNPEQFDPERDLLIEANSDISRALLAHLISGKVSSQMENNDTPLDGAQTEEMGRTFIAQLVDLQIAEWVNKGFLIEKDGLLTTTLRIQNKTRTLNGKAWNEDDLFSAQMPSAPPP
ncbi:MAG: YdgA family protein [Zoogloeaceae bacterium]|jgi:uncharacterized protein YdgA (DUF945 family)|nr:YdgA family protein [Zoogloeaceae bacterium]